MLVRLQALACNGFLQMWVKLHEVASVVNEI
jgi:hypothetical protein